MAKGIFARMADIVKANINDLLDKAEDPERMINQMVLEMEEAVNKATASVGTAIANEKRLEKQLADHERQTQEWERKAMLAVEKGSDELARKALERKAFYAKATEDLKPALEEARRTSAQLRVQLEQLKAKLDEARVRQGVLIARHRTAQAKKVLAQSVTGIGDDAFSSFERFERKVEVAEAEAEAHAELAGESSLDEEFAKLEQKDSVDAELEALKARMGKGGTTA